MGSLGADATATEIGSHTSLGSASLRATLPIDPQAMPFNKDSGTVYLNRTLLCSIPRRSVAKRTSNRQQIQHYSCPVGTTWASDRPAFRSGKLARLHESLRGDRIDLFDRSCPADHSEAVSPWNSGARRSTTPRRTGEKHETRRLASLERTRNTLDRLAYGPPGSHEQQHEGISDCGVSCPSGGGGNTASRSG